jgi:hypothetical protein
MREQETEETTGLHGQVESDQARAFLVQANLPDESVPLPPQT